MKYEIDLTGINFDRIDFSEAEIIKFNFNKEIGNEFSFDVWGATILLAAHWSHSKNFMLDDINRDMYVSGAGKIRIANLIGGKVSIYMYESLRNEQNVITTIAKSDEIDVVYENTWGKVSDFKNCVQEYTWDCVIIEPYGFCNLTLYSQEKITFEYNYNDMVDANKYLNNTGKYSFRKNNH